MPDFSFSFLRTELVQGVLVATVSRPKALNALNSAVLSELEILVSALEKSASVSALIVTGDGPKAFVAGADIEEMLAMSPEDAERFSEWGQSVFSRLESLECPTIAAVNGYALGGGNELAMACDIRIAAENAKFGQPEVGLGIIPGFGGIKRLTQIVGKPKALELIMTGRVIGAKEALDIGLVSKVVPEGQALAEAIALAKTMSVKSRYAITRAKRAIRNGAGLPLDEALAIERGAFKECFAGSDRLEGMKAFIEKRTPKFN